jgi:RES domain-containing protein
MPAFSYLEPHPSANDVLSQQEYERLYVLIEAIESDVEAWVNSSIACCDVCYDDFVLRWPLAYHRDVKLQIDSIDPSAFYDGSKHVKEEFKEPDFFRLWALIACPRCGEPMGGNIFPFEFPFSRTRFFEEAFEELGKLAYNTPFLVLSNSLARDIFEEVKNTCSKISAATPYQRLYRGRCIENPTFDAFDAPPASMLREGRYNHAGKPVLYLASDERTCWDECRKPKTKFFILEFSVQSPLLLLNFSDFDQLSDLSSALIYSSLMSSPTDSDSWNRPEYILTRFVADSARAAGVDGIIYPSCRDSSGDNIVLLDSSKWKSALKPLRIIDFSHRHPSK